MKKKKKKLGFLEEKKNVFRLFFVVNNLFVWLGLAWLGLAWFGLVWLGLVWFGLAI